MRENSAFECQFCDAEILGLVAFKVHLLTECVNFAAVLVPENRLFSMPVTWKAGDVVEMTTDPLEVVASITTFHADGSKTVHEFHRTGLGTTRTEKSQ